MSATKSNKVYAEYGLTTQEMEFCHHYAAQNFSNATQAYLKAYGGGYNTANTRGPWLLKKEKVREYLYMLQKDAYEAALITPERVAKELADIAFAAKGDKDYSATSKLKALDLLQKQLGLQQQRVKVEPETVTIEVTVDD